MSSAVAESAMSLRARVRTPSLRAAREDPCHRYVFSPLALPNQAEKMAALATAQRHGRPSNKVIHSCSPSPAI